jgi:Flp pilus assembly protein TadG
MSQRKPTGSARRRKRQASGRGWAPGRTRGQSLVEFSLVIPIFLVMLLALIEFGFLFNAVLTANYATRDASLVGSEAGSSEGADCVIISKVLDDMRAPVDATQLTQIIIYRAKTAGDPYNGTYVNSGNVWVRSGTTDCSAYGKSATLPYTLTTANYPEGTPDTSTGNGGRCNFLNGCPNNTLRTRDAIGVQVTYTYQWHTPLGDFPFGFGGNVGGFTIVRSNEMRMEPVL